MNFSDVIAECKSSLKELDAMVTAIEHEVITGNHGIELITNNVNFFTKSFLITLCAHLEMGIKDIVFAVAKNIDSRLSIAAIPTSIVEWRYGPKNKKQEKCNPISRFGIGLTKKEVDELVSGNVYRTRDALSLVGVDLTYKIADWEAWKELIQTIVTRRNNIVHHNDDASDLSFGDIRLYIKKINEYFDFINEACNCALSPLV